MSQHLFLNIEIFVRLVRWTEKVLHKINGRELRAYKLLATSLIGRKMVANIRASIYFEILQFLSDKPMRLRKVYSFVRQALEAEKCLTNI